MRFLFLPLVAFAACACYGQSLTLGVVGGGRLTDDIAGNATSDSRRYILGPEAEIGLPFGIALEFDALYRRQGYDSTSSVPDVVTHSHERANSWEFPILLKYKTAFPVVKPFVEAGYAPRVIHGNIDTTVCGNTSTGCGTPVSSGTNWRTSHGLVLGAGVQVGILRLRISPEVRYTRWNNTAINVAQFFGFHSTQNQFDALVGIGWKMH